MQSSHWLNRPEAVESVILLVAVAVARYEYQLQLGAETTCGVHARVNSRL